MSVKKPIHTITSKSTINQHTYNMTLSLIGGFIKKKFERELVR